MKILILLITVGLSFQAWTQTEFVGGASESEQSETAIEQQWFVNLDLEEPVFSSRKFERDLAAYSYDKKPQGLGWQGQLAVVKEIPYSYPWLTHSTLQLRTLNEIEKEESQTSVSDQ